MVSAIVLAAGKSRRMGRSKPLLPFGQATVIETVVDRLLAAPVDEVIVVVPASSRIPQVLSDRRVVCAVNPDPEGEMLSSAQVGLRSSSPEAEWAILALADQPFVPVSVYRRLLARCRVPAGPPDNSRPLLLVPTFDGRKGHPLVLRRDLFAQALALGPQQTLKHLVCNHLSDLVTVPVEDGAILRDMDDPESYQRELARLRSGESRETPWV